MQQQRGKVIIPATRSPWPHEERVAKILAKLGHTVEFLVESGVSGSPDIIIGNVRWEIKSPLTNKYDKLERNIKRALLQSNNIIFDSSRVKNMRDDRIYKFLLKKSKEQRTINRLIFVNKKGEVIDIKGHL